MGESVKSVFKALISIPIIVVIIVGAFNIFAFVNTYFKLMSLSYAIQNVVVQNNYIPSAERTTLLNTMSGMETRILTDIELVNEYEVTTRRQYGEQVTCGITGNFHWIIPGMPHANPSKTQMVDSNGALVDGPNVIWDERTDGSTMYDRFTTVPITITYTVPGLKYYPDM